MHGHAVHIWFGPRFPQRTRCVQLDLTGPVKVSESMWTLGEQRVLQVLCNLRVQGHNGSDVALQRSQRAWDAPALGRPVPQARCMLAVAASQLLQ